MDDTGAIYAEVAEDVMGKMAERFHREGMGTIVEEFRQKWLEKLTYIMNTGPTLRAPPVGDGSNVPDFGGLAPATPSPPVMFAPAAEGEPDSAPPEKRQKIVAAAGAGAEAPAAPGQRQIDGESDEEPLGSDLDDPDDVPIGDIDANCVAVALYESVKHPKGKWKIVLRDGIIMADGKPDFVFHKATCDLAFT